MDDDDAVRAMKNATMERKGFDVVAAASVTEALKGIATERFGAHKRLPLSGNERIGHLPELIEDLALRRRGFVSLEFSLRNRKGPMFASKREKWAGPQIVALVELDIHKMRVHIVLSPEAIRERLRELKDPSGTIPRERQGSRHAQL